MELNKKIAMLTCLTSLIFGTNFSLVGSSDNSIHLNKMYKQFEIDANIKKEQEEQKRIEELKKVEKKRKNSVTYLRSNMTVVSNITESEMKEVLLTYKGSKTMAHLSNALVDAEAKTGVNAFALAAIIALESGFATSRRAVEDNNLTGFEVYSDSSKGKLFDSQYESVVFTANHLNKNYLTEEGSYYKGLSVDDVQKSYCPDEGKNKRWEEKVDKLASSFLSTYKEIYLTEN